MAEQLVQACNVTMASGPTTPMAIV
jgi:hypothetical protein